MTDTARQRDLSRFYGLLHDLKQRVGGMRKLKNCTGYIDWPDRGVYFFPEPGETHLSDQMRVTHVGTHAVSEGSSTSLWDRLKQHYGTARATGVQTTLTGELTGGQCIASALMKPLSKNMTSTRTTLTGTNVGQASSVRGLRSVTRNIFSNAV